MEDSRQTFDLTPLHEVVRAWQDRRDTTRSSTGTSAATWTTAAPEDDITLESVIGARP